MSKFKNSKFIILTTIITLILGFNFCYAVDLNLTDDLIDDFSSNNVTQNTNNTNTSDVSTTNNTNSNTNTDNTNNTNSNITSNTNSSTTSGNASSTSATVTNSLPESDLGLSNILNILLIVIGILLVLLSIAILIRLKK